MKKKKVTYLNTYGDGGYSYQDYLEHCEINNEEVGEEGSADYWGWVQSMIVEDVDDFIDNIRYAKRWKIPVVVSGYLGLWWSDCVGIENTMFKTLEAALLECWEGADDVEITLEDGVLHFKGMHHDGNNHFEIRPLTERGERLMRDGERINVNSHWHVAKFPKYLY